MSAQSFAITPGYRLSGAESMPFPASHQSARQKWHEFFQLVRLRLPHMFALAVAVGGSELLTTYPLMADADAVAIYFWIAGLLLNRMVFLLIVIAALSAAQVWLSGTRTRTMAMAVAILVISVGISALHSSEWWAQTMQYSRNWGDAQNGLFLYLFWINAAFSSLLAVLYEWQARAVKTMAAVRATQFEGEAIERQTLESRLSGMKARIDPEFLFAVIAHIETLYLENIDAAERLLEQLIDFLRATLPRSRDAVATLEVEIRLCAAYLAIEKSLRADTLSYQTKADADSSATYFPPSVLLPLLETLMVPRTKASRPVHLSISAHKRPDGVTVELTSHAASAPPLRETLDVAAAALRVFFGRQVSVVARSPTFPGNTIIIEVPNVAQ